MRNRLHIQEGTDGTLKKKHQGLFKPHIDVLRC